MAHNSWIGDNMLAEDLKDDKIYKVEFKMSGRFIKEAMESKRSETDELTAIIERALTLYRVARYIEDQGGVWRYKIGQNTRQVNIP